MNNEEIDRRTFVKQPGVAMLAIGIVKLLPVSAYQDVALMTMQEER